MTYYLKHEKLFIKYKVQLSFLLYFRSFFLSGNAKSFRSLVSKISYVIPKLRFTRLENKGEVMGCFFQKYRLRMFYLIFIFNFLNNFLGWGRAGGPFYTPLPPHTFMVFAAKQNRKRLLISFLPINIKLKQTCSLLHY